jgi:cellulose synthase/poly-beta-1,6-N-acetylglucosamine synthase-like glycosyltransferase
VRVTEGRASTSTRRLYLALVPAVVLAASAAAAAPPVRAFLLWANVALAATLLARMFLLSLLARFWPDPAADQTVGRPSFVFVIPCLNEIDSLRHTVPALTRLRYDGRLQFCYVCEAASTDGSLEYLRAWCRRDPRVVVLWKPLPPAGRGAAIGYGAENAPEADVIGFLDADHVVPQETLDELVRAFGAADAPDGVQGRCLTSNARPNALARVLTIERQWLERTELQVCPRLGGMSQFGGGQGFFRRELFRHGSFRVDASMILDDTDLSFRLARAGCRIDYRPLVTTTSLQPQSGTEFLDQRVRWIQGWLQLARKHLPACLRAPGLRPALRADMLRLLLTPYMSVPLLLGFAAAGIDAVAGGAGSAPLWTRWVALAWPMGFGLSALLAGRAARSAGDAVLALVGLPLLTCSHVLIACVALVHMYVLRRPVTYAKTHKHDAAATPTEVPVARAMHEADPSPLDALLDAHQTVESRGPSA